MFVGEVRQHGTGTLIEMWAERPFSVKWRNGKEIASGGGISPSATTICQMYPLKTT